MAEPKMMNYVFMLAGTDPEVNKPAIVMICNSCSKTWDFSPTPRGPWDLWDIYQRAKSHNRSCRVLNRKT